MYFDVASRETGEDPVRGGRNLLTFVRGRTTVKSVDLECRRATIQHPKKKPEVRYGCRESRDGRPLRLGEGSHAVEMNFLGR